MSAEVFHLQGGMASQSLPGEAGNDSSGPASVLVATPESTSPPTTDILSDTLSKKALDNIPSISLDSVSQNGHHDQSKLALSNGSYESSTGTNSSQAPKLANGHHESPIELAPVVVTSSNPTTAAEMFDTQPPEVEQVEEIKKEVERKETTEVVIETATSANPPETLPAPPAPEEADASSSDQELSVEDTDESYASDLESATPDLPRYELMRYLCLLQTTHF